MKDCAFYLIAALGLAATLVAIALVNGCASNPKASMINGVPNLAQVAPAIWRGGQPTAEGWVTLYRLGATNVVKLNPVGEGSDAMAHQAGMIVQYFPISLTDQTIGVPEKATLDAAVKAIRPGTFIHCLHGQDRTGFVVALWRVRVCGWTKERAHAEMMARGFHPMLRGLMWAWENEPESKL